MQRKYAILMAILATALAYIIHEPLPPEEFSPWLLAQGLVTAVRVTGLLTDFALYFGFNAPVFYRDTASILSSIIQLTKTPDPTILRTDIEFDGVMVRVYEPVKKAGTKLRRGVVFYHGGGFVFGDLDMYDEMVSSVSKHLDAVVVSVKLAPEHTYPAAPDDCERATRYFISHAQYYHVDTHRLALMGDSAGGNLAAVISLRLRNSNFSPMPKLQVLIYPVTQLLHFDTPSHRARAQGPILEKYRSCMYIAAYLFGNEYRDNIQRICNGDYTSKKTWDSVMRNFMDIDNLPQDDEYIVNYKAKSMDEFNHDSILEDTVINPDTSPLFANDLNGIPETYISTCQYDPLRDHGYFFVKRLKDANVTVHHDNLQACVHGWTLALDVYTFRAEWNNVLDIIHSKL